MYAVKMSKMKKYIITVVFIGVFAIIFLQNSYARPCVELVNSCPAGWDEIGQKTLYRCFNRWATVDGGRDKYAGAHAEGYVPCIGGNQSSRIMYVCCKQE